MRTLSDGVCQWIHCDAQAIKDVWYGLPVHDALDKTPLSAMSYTTKNCQFCNKHAAQVTRQFVYVTEFELE